MQLLCTFVVASTLCLLSIDAKLHFSCIPVFPLQNCFIFPVYVKVRRNCRWNIKATHLLCIARILPQNRYSSRIDWNFTDHTKGVLTETAHMSPHTRSPSVIYTDFLILARQRHLLPSLTFFQQQQRFPVQKCLCSASPWAVVKDTKYKSRQTEKVHLLVGNNKSS